ncbi:MAG: Lrp/AsnC family transcriptional regulator [Pseudomonadota bacterium]
MSDMLDPLDRKILAALQQDATRPLDDVAREVGSSKTPVWNRIRKMREAGVIDRQVAIVDPSAVGLTSCFYVLIRTARHEKEWLEQFVTALRKRPEILEAHRLAGDIDYILKVRVADAAAYDAFYRSLVADVSIFNVTSLLSMEEIISRTELPVTETDQEAP